jgi:hypothetical protein
MRRPYGIMGKIAFFYFVRDHPLAKRKETSFSLFSLLQ